MRFERIWNECQRIRVNDGNGGLASLFRPLSSRFSQRMFSMRIWPSIQLLRIGVIGRYYHNRTTIQNNECPEEKSPVRWWLLSPRRITVMTHNRYRCLSLFWFIKMSWKLNNRTTNSRIDLSMRSNRLFLLVVYCELKSNNAFSRTRIFLEKIQVISKYVEFVPELVEFVSKLIKSVAHFVRPLCASCFSLFSHFGNHLQL